MSLPQIVKEVTSYCQLAKRLGYKQCVGNTVSTLKNRVIQQGIDTSHFKGQGWNKGKTFPKKRKIEDYFNSLVKISSSKLRQRLIEEGFKEHRCENCKLEEWLGNPIPLELHHKDYNKQNNKQNNLQLLCPTCHSLIPNHSRKNL